MSTKVIVKVVDRVSLNVFRGRTHAWERMSRRQWERYLSIYAVL